MSDSGRVMAPTTVTSRIPDWQLRVVLRVRGDLMQPFGRDCRSVAACRQRRTGDVTPDFLDDVVEGQVPKVDQSLAENTTQGMLSTAAVIRQTEVERRQTVWSSS